MRISDWSSDVCSSDLVEAVTLKEAQRIGLICRVRQEQRHHAVQAIDVIDPLLGRQPIQGLDAVTKRREAPANRSEEHTSELQSLMRISYAVFCLKKKKHILNTSKH